MECSPKKIPAPLVEQYGRGHLRVARMLQSCFLLITFNYFNKRICNFRLTLLEILRVFIFTKMVLLNVGINCPLWYCAKFWGWGELNANTIEIRMRQ